MKTKIVVQHYYTKRDRNGNCYWFARLTSTVDGETISFTTPHSSNTDSIAHEALGDWGPILTMADSEIGKREYNRRTKEYKHNSCKDQWVIDWIRDHC